MHAATDRQTAREIVRPKKRFSTTLVIGGEAVNGYLAAAQADNRNVESQKMLVVIRDADIDPDVSVDVRSFTQIPRIVRV